MVEKYWNFGGRRNGRRVLWGGETDQNDKKGRNHLPLKAMKKWDRETREMEEGSGDFNLIGFLNNGT
jgi:hypothetical protein